MRKSATIWLTEKCNLRCKYCFEESKRCRRDMEERVLHDATTFLKANKFNELQFFGGEPTLKPNMMKYLFANLGTDFKFGVTTNGTMLDGLFDWFEVFNVAVSISLDGTKRTQDYWRSNSYDSIVKSVPQLLRMKRPPTVLMTVAEPKDLFENTKHIKDLGFHWVFGNLLSPYSFGYKKGDDVIYAEQYERCLKELVDKDFKIADYGRWLKLLTREREHRRIEYGCGFNRRGLSINVDGLIYPCHRANELGKEFSFGDIWNGIDPERERKIREMAVPPKKCLKCPLHLLPCPVNCYAFRGEFGVDPPEEYCAVSKAKAKVVMRFAGRI